MRRTSSSSANVTVAARESLSSPGDPVWDPRQLEYRLDPAADMSERSRLDEAPLRLANVSIWCPPVGVSRVDSRLCEWAAAA